MYRLAAKRSLDPRHVPDATFRKILSAGNFSFSLKAEEKNSGSLSSAGKRGLREQQDATNKKRRTALSQGVTPDQNGVNFWSEASDQLQTYFDRIRERDAEESICHDRLSGMTRDLRLSTRGIGRMRYEAIQKALDSMGLDRETHQRAFHNLALNACSKFIYGDDFQECSEEIFARTKTNEIRQEILVQTPRRFGKTTMVAMICAALIMYLPGFKIGIFSPSQETSRKMLNLIYTYLTQLPGYNEKREVVNNSTQITLAEFPLDQAFNNPIRQSTIYSYSASERSTRGFTGRSSTHA